MKEIIKNELDRIIPLLSMLGLIFIALSFYAFMLQQLTYNSGNYDGIGFTDAIEYWSAFKAWQAGANPYDDMVVHHIQSAVRNSDYAIMMWNPPWLLTLFSPVLSIDNFLAYARIWALLSLLAYLAGTICLIRSFAPSYIKDSRLWLIILSSAPFISALSFGQIGSWLFLGTALIMIGMKIQNSALTGLGAILISLKPHLFVVFGICTVIIMVRQRLWRILIIFICSPLSLAILTEYLSADYLTITWLNTISGSTPPNMTPRPQLWITTTVPSVLMEWLSISEPATKTSLGLIFILIATALGIKLTSHEPLIAGLSKTLLVTLPLLPFGWLYDYCILMTALIFFWPDIASSPRGPRNILCSSLILLLSCSLLISRLEEALLPLLIFVTSILLSCSGQKFTKISDLKTRAL